MTTDELANILLSFPKHTPTIFRYNTADYYAEVLVSAETQKDKVENYDQLSAEVVTDESTDILEELNSSNECACILTLEGKL